MHRRRKEEVLWSLEKKKEEDEEGEGDGDGNEFVLYFLSMETERRKGNEGVSGKGSAGVAPPDPDRAAASTPSF